MLRRIVLVAGAAAVAVPLLSGTASASCLDDYQAGVDAGYTSPQYSPYWGAWVGVQGAATVTVYGDALVADAREFGDESVEWVSVIADNAPDNTTGFVNCVAG